jgi:hypothetical protein
MSRCSHFSRAAPGSSCPTISSRIHKPSFYDPEINRSYARMAAHYRVGILPARPHTPRDKAKVEAVVRFAQSYILGRLRHPASVEDIDYHAQRGLDRVLLLKLCGCDWIRQHRNLLVTGPTGIGKSWIACALGHKACRENLSVLYQRVPRLMAALALARGDGRYAKLLRSLARVNLLILDDWRPEPLGAEQRRDLLEIVEDRYDSGSFVDHQPAADRALVRADRRSYAGRRHPRSRHPQRLPHRAQRRQPAQAAPRPSLPDEPARIALRGEIQGRQPCHVVANRPAIGR